MLQLIVDNRLLDSCQGQTDHMPLKSLLEAKIVQFDRHAFDQAGRCTKLGLTKEQAVLHERHF